MTAVIAVTGLGGGRTAEGDRAGEQQGHMAISTYGGLNTTFIDDGFRKVKHVHGGGGGHVVFGQGTGGQQHGVGGGRPSAAASSRAAVWDILHGWGRGDGASNHS